MHNHMTGSEAQAALTRQHVHLAPIYTGLRCGSQFASKGACIDALVSPHVHSISHPQAKDARPPAQVPMTAPAVTGCCCMSGTPHRLESSAQLYALGCAHPASTKAGLLCGQQLQRRLVGLQKDEHALKGGSLLSVDITCNLILAPVKQAEEGFPGEKDIWKCLELAIGCVADSQGCMWIAWTQISKCCAVRSWQSRQNGSMHAQTADQQQQRVRRLACWWHGSRNPRLPSRWTAC